MLVGDDWKKIEEAEALAKQHLGCQIYRSSFYWRKEGHVQVPGPCTKVGVLLLDTMLLFFTQSALNIVADAQMCHSPCSRNRSMSACMYARVSQRTEGTKSALPFQTEVKRPWMLAV